MRKNKLFLLLALLLTAATGAWAQGPVDGTIAWSVGNEASATVSASIKDAISSTGVTTGSGLTVNIGRYFDTEMARYQPATTNAGNVEGVMIEYTIEAVDGYKFKPTGVDYAAVKDGADNASYSWSYTIDGVESAITDVSYTSVLRNNGSNSGTAQMMHNESITAEGCSVFTLRFYISNCGNTKKIGIANITISGSVSAAAAAGYTVSMKDGVKDADKWTVKVGEGQAQALPIGGLKGDGKETVTLQYNGRLKVKGVKATSEAAPAEASVPDGALSGKFSVSDGKQVYFSKGNLRYESSKWSFFDNQYDYYSSYSADAWDHFGWSTSATDYGKNTSTVKSDYSGDFVDWGATMGTGWFTLSKDEWTYLLKTRSASTVGGTENGRYAKAKVNDVKGVILFPDTYTHPDGVTAPTNVNTTNASFDSNTYTVADWTKMETAGCVFLPAAGYRYGTSVNDSGTDGIYWSATPAGASNAYGVYFAQGGLLPADTGTWPNGCSVRLVSEVTTSDAPAEAKEPATVTTAPTGAAIVGVGKTTALVSGGAAEGGTMMYKVTTENTKPASTVGFSDEVPTAQSITASGKVYVWYYVKGDDTHSDSEIAATAIEVPVANIVWDITNVSGLDVSGTYTSYEKEGITLSGNGEEVFARWSGNGNPTTDGIRFDAMASGGYTFTAPTGKKFTKIEMKAQGPGGWDGANLGDGWAFNIDWETYNFTVTWTGSAASAVGLLTGAGEFQGDKAKYIAFYLSE